MVSGGQREWDLDTCTTANTKMYSAYKYESGWRVESVSNFQTNEVHDHVVVAPIVHNDVARSRP